MKSLIFLFNSLLISLVILLSSSTLYSFSAIPTATPVEVAPPLEKKAVSKRNKHLHKRYNHLHQRFEKASTDKQRLRLQKKIRQVERQQLSDKPTPIWGVLGLTLGLSAMVMVPLITLISIYVSPAGAALAFILAIFAAVTGLVLSIVSLVLHQQHPERYTKKGFGIAGVIVSGIMVALLGLSTFLLYLRPII